MRDDCSLELVAIAPTIQLFTGRMFGQPAVGDKTCNSGVTMICFQTLLLPLTAEIPTLRVDKWHKAPVMLNGVRGRGVKTIHYHGYSGKKVCKGNT